MNSDKNDTNDNELSEVAKCKNDCAVCLFSDKNCKPNSFVIESEYLRKSLDSGNKRPNITIIWK